MAQGTTLIYHWGYLSPVLCGIERESLAHPFQEPIPVVDLISSSPTDTPHFFDFVWRPPDLTADGDWYNKRIVNLQRACIQYDNSNEMYDNGLQRLERHRKNYDADGPNSTFLQLL